MTNMTMPKFYRDARSLGHERRLYTCQIPMLAPGESTELTVTPQDAFVCERIVVALTAAAPDIRYYQKRVGGSKRRGRLASIRWASETLRHDPHRAMIWLDDITIAVKREIMAQGDEAPMVQLVRESQLASSVPLEMFRPDAVDMGLRLPITTKPLEFHVTNREFSRAAGGNMVCMGRTFR